MHFMIEQIFLQLSLFEDFLWGYVGVPIIMILGLYLTFQSRFFQIREFPHILKTFYGFLKVHDNKSGAVHPLKAFFASLGGCVGVGNVVSICTAVQIGGPGALFWIWMTAFAGMMLKYAEVFLGIRYRVPDGKGGYNGGPMYFLQQPFKTKNIANFAALLLCIYGVEIYQFNVVTETIAKNTNISEFWIIGALLAFVFFAVSGGVRRVGEISSVIIPLFVILYVGMASYVLWQNIGILPDVMKQVFTSAFTGHAATGGFVGSTLMLTMSQGVRRGSYTGDVGIGYASVIYSESMVRSPEKQAALTIFDIFIDTFIICTTSLMLILLTGVWKEPIEASQLVQTALSQYFPYMHFFMPLFLFLLGYSTINAFFCVGVKSAEFLSPKYGKSIYYSFGLVMFFLFSLIGTEQAQTIMTIAGGLLLVINCYGIFLMRKEISYNFK